MDAASSPANRKISSLLFCACFSFLSISVQAQQTVAAGPQYKKSSFHQWLWGKHYRKEWTTPVTVPLFYLDTAQGGLKPYQAGGGRQSKTLRLRDAAGREYVIRSIDKTFGGALPPVYQNTFVEKIVDDQVSLGHPYAAVTIPMLSEAAKVYHTNPRIVYIPQQPALDSFNQEYGNRLYLFEQRPDENWETAANFGNAKNIVGTDKMLEKIQEDNDNQVDQLTFVRARLLDMLIGDGSRHEDQWRWGSFKEDGKTIYKAIPRDRDQAYAKFDGWLLRTILNMAKISHLQTFGYTIPDVRTNNFPSRNLDRRVANEVTKEQWIAIAKEIKQLVTDEVIEQAVRQLPAEVFPISGNTIISKLKARREHLEEYAADYYTFLAKQVEVPGSEENELFKVMRLANGQTTVTVSKISKKGKTEATPFYTRLFDRKETKEIRLYGLAGNDVYEVEGEAQEAIPVRIIGGTDRDSITDRSKVRGAEKKTIIYDDHNNAITSSGETKLNLSDDSAVHAYKYDGFKYNYERIQPVVFYSFEDKAYVGIAYNLVRHGWRSEPYKNKQTFQVNYSVIQQALSFSYHSDFKQLLGKWSLRNEAVYDLLRWTNFYGLGNDTKEEPNATNYYQLQTKDLFAAMNFYHPLGKHANFSIGPVYNMVEVLEDADRFVSKSIIDHTHLYDPQHFAGGQAGFTYSNVNNSVVPSKGFYFATGARYLQNLKEDRHIVRYDAQVQVFATLFKNMILAIRPAAATVTGNPEFYQHVSIGGSNTLRGYSRDRFWGTSSFYSDNELQYLFIHGRYGLTGFYDVGKVWQKGESSSTWHTGYGGGIIVAPFSKALASLTYGLSKEGNFIHIRLYRSL